MSEPGDAPDSSQGFNAYGVTGVRKCTTKVARRSNAASSKLDASTLAIAHGGNRVYEDGLTDNGPGGSGSIVTVSMEGLGEKPEVGDTITAEGETCKCTESTSDDNVGELAAWSASYTSDYTD
jgi:hypothetical protein